MLTPLWHVAEMIVSPAIATMLLSAVGMSTQYLSQDQLFILRNKDEEIKFIKKFWQLYFLSIEGWVKNASSKKTFFAKINKVEKVIPGLKQFGELVP